MSSSGRHFFLLLEENSVTLQERVITLFAKQLNEMNKQKEISFKDRDAIFGKLEYLASQANLTEDERARLEEIEKL